MTLKLIAKILKLFAVLLIIFIYNYFDDPAKLFSNLYLAKFLNTLVKSFFRLQLLFFNNYDNYNIMLCRKESQIIYNIFKRRRMIFFSQVITCIINMCMARTVRNLLDIFTSFFSFHIPTILHILSKTLNRR